MSNDSLNGISLRDEGHWYALDRFDNNYIPKPNSGCWIWLGWTNSKYGLIYSRQYGRTLAHRVAYEMFVGPIPLGLVVDHLCNNKLCVNPDHLEAKSQKENLRRGACATARHIDKSHCDNGHELIGENISIRLTKYGINRSCKVCCRARAAKSKAKRKLPKPPTTKE